MEIRYRCGVQVTLRLRHQLVAVTVTLLLMTTSAEVYVRIPYQLHTKMVYDVNVYSQNTWANLLNVTFAPIKDYSIGDCSNNSQPVYFPQGNLGSLLNESVVMKVNFTLARDGTPIAGGACRLEISFSRSGEYHVVIAPIIYQVPSGTYTVILFYKSGFNSTTTIETSSWNSTLVL